MKPLYRVVGPDLDGRFRCESIRTGDTTDQTFDSVEEAQKWADETTAKICRPLTEEEKREIADRKARRAANGPLADQFFIDKNAH